MDNKKTVDVTFADGRKIKIYVSSPTAKTVQRADRYRAKVWTECIEDGIKTKDELAMIMEKRGVWTKEHRKKEEDITARLIQCEKDLYLGDGKKKVPLSDGKDIAVEMRVLRNDLRQLYIDKTSMEQNSAEALADNARFDYVVACSTFYENGQNVYNGIDDYNSKSSDELAFTAAGALAEMMYNYDPKTEESLPENQWLKTFDLVNDNLSLVNEDKKLVDLQGRPINEFGFYINDEGKRIDQDGNLLDSNGNYVIKVDYEKPSARKRPRKTTKATKTKVTTESSRVV